MRAIDYETKRIHTVNPFFACVFLRRMFRTWAFVLTSWSWVWARSFRVPFRQLSARPYRTLALISVKGRKLTTRPHILFGVELRLTLLVFKIVMFYKFTFQHNPQCSPPNPSHCEGFCTTASSPLRLTCEPSSPINAFSHILFYRRSKLIILENRNLSFFDQKIKKNSSKHCVWKIEVCEFLWIPSKRLRRINEKNQFIERIVWLSIKTNKQT